MQLLDFLSLVSFCDKMVNRLVTHLRIIVLYDVLVTVKAAPYECIIRASQP